MEKLYQAVELLKKHYENEFSNLEIIEYPGDRELTIAYDPDKYGEMIELLNTIITIKSELHNEAELILEYL